MITGTLAGKLKDFASESTRNSYRTKILFDTNQLLQNSTSSEEIVTIMAKQIQKLLSKSVIVYVKEMVRSIGHMFSCTIKKIPLSI